MVIIINVQILSIVTCIHIFIIIVFFLNSIVALSVKGLQANVPLFEPRENNVSFYAGDTATLLCSVTGLQTRFVSMLSKKKHKQLFTLKCFFF